MKNGLKKTALTTLTFLTLGAGAIFGQNQRSVHQDNTDSSQSISESESTDFESMSLEQRMDAAKWPAQDKVPQADKLFVKNYLDKNGYQVSKYSIDNVSFIAVGNEKLMERYVGLTIIYNVEDKEETYFEQAGHKNISTTSSRQDISEELGFPLLKTSVKATDKTNFSQEDANRILKKIKDFGCDDYIISIAELETVDQIGKKYLVVTNFDGITRKAYPSDKNDDGSLESNTNVNFRKEGSGSGDDSRDGRNQIGVPTYKKGIVSVEVYGITDFNESHGAGGAIRVRLGHKSPVSLSLGYNYLQDNLESDLAVVNDVLDPNIQGYVTAHFDDLITKKTDINYNGSAGLILDLSKNLALSTRLDFASFTENESVQTIQRNVWTASGQDVDPTADLYDNPVGEAVNSMSSVPFKPAKINLGAELKLSKRLAGKVSGGLKLYDSKSPATIDAGLVYHF